MMTDWTFSEEQLKRFRKCINIGKITVEFYNEWKDPNTSYLNRKFTWDSLLKIYLMIHLIRLLLAIESYVRIIYIQIDIYPHPRFQLALFGLSMTIYYNAKGR